MKSFFKSLMFIIIMIVFFAFCGSCFAQKVIPKINKIHPAYGAVNVDTQTEISIYFNTVMDKRSVEKKFYIFPEVKGSLRWKNNTMVFPRKVGTFLT